MNIVVVLVGSFLIFPKCCDFQETEEILEDTITSTFSFPKDRVKSPTTRVIGGSETTPNAYPFQVAIYVYMNDKDFFCGGTLIARDWVLTAAHCLSEDPLYVSVLLGSHNLSASESNRLQLTSSSFIVHEGWDSTTLQNDIALVRLPTNVTLNAYINTVNYASGDQSYEDEIATIIGWGLTELGGDSISAILKHVDAPILSNDECASTDSEYKKVIVPSHLCTSGLGIIGSCSGDSGGPLIVDGVQVGIVSFGSTDCNSGKPSVFTRVAQFSDWIEENATGGCRFYTSLPNTILISALICMSSYLSANLL